MTITHMEYFQSCTGWTEIQYWDVYDQMFHSYLVEGGFLMDELIGEAANILEEMPEGSKVYITCGDVNRLMELKVQLDQDYLIENVVFIPPVDIMKGHLRGKMGTLIICDKFLLNAQTLDFLYREQQLMKCLLP